MITRTYCCSFCPVEFYDEQTRTIHEKTIHLDSGLLTANRRRRRRISRSTATLVKRLNRRRRDGGLEEGRGSAGDTEDEDNDDDDDDEDGDDDCTSDVSPSSPSSSTLGIRPSNDQHSGDAMPPPILFCSQCSLGFPHIYALADHMHHSHGYNHSNNHSNNHHATIPTSASGGGGGYMNGHLANGGGNLSPAGVAPKSTGADCKPPPQLQVVRPTAVRPPADCGTAATIVAAPSERQREKGLQRHYDSADGSTHPPIEVGFCTSGSDVKLSMH